MPEKSLILVYEPDRNPTVFGNKDEYRLIEGGQVTAESRFFTNSSTEIDFAGEGSESYQMKRYEKKTVDFELDAETVEEYFNKIEEGLNQDYMEGPQIHIQIGESIGLENIENISSRTEPASIAEVRRSLGERSRVELGDPDAFHLE